MSVDICIFCIYAYTRKYAIIKEQQTKEGSNMPEKTPAQKRAQENYMKKFHVARVRMEISKHEVVDAHAQSRGESLNAFINRAIDETMRRDNESKISE